MTDIINAVDKSLSIAKNIHDKIDNADTRHELADLYNELSDAKVALIIRKRMEKKLLDFDFHKDTVLVDAVFGVNPY
jgi:hypothetical protein